MSNVVGTLNNEEREEIEDLYEKKIALENLIKIIDVSNETLYSKLIKDYGNTVKLFQNWWVVTSCKHNWEGKTWTINFDNNEVLTL